MNGSGHQDGWNRWAWLLRVLAPAAVACFMASGCASSNPLAGQQVAAYTPDVSAAERMPWDGNPASGGERPAASGNLLPPEREPPADDAGADYTDDSDAPAAAPINASPTRVLRRDDRLTISLRGIPGAADIPEVIDSDGNVNLPYIDVIKLEGYTTAEAERVIERAYVQGGIYRSINVSVLTQEDSYFVRGEVVRPGKYPLVGDTTLVMAIISAGGYTDYAKPSEVKVGRGDKEFKLNATKMERRETEDFLIRDNDVIVVPRRIVF